MGRERKRTTGRRDEDRSRFAGGVAGLSGVARISAGASHSIAVRSDGSVRSWGANSSGQLGLGTTNAALVPALVTGVSDAVECDAGRVHTVCLIRNGQIAAWGNNSSGQLGDGTLAARLTPTPVVGLAAQTLTKVRGDGQSARVGSAFRQRFQVRVTNASGSPVPGLPSPSQRRLPALPAPLRRAASRLRQSQDQMGWRQRPPSQRTHHPARIK